MWLHDSVQQVAYKMLSPRARMVLYSKIGKAFLKSIRPENLEDLLYEVLALLNNGVDAEDSVQRRTIANLNLLFSSKPRANG
jgi:predicted ATPase